MKGRGKKRALKPLPLSSFATAQLMKDYDF